MLSLYPAKGKLSHLFLENIVMLGDAFLHLAAVHLVSVDVLCAAEHIELIIVVDVGAVQNTKLSVVHGLQRKDNNYYDR